MLWTISDRQVDQHMGWSADGLVERTVTRIQSDAAPTTAQQLLFLIESVDGIDGDGPTAVAN